MRRRSAALAAAGVLAAAGGSGCLAWAATHQVSAPRPSAAAAGRLDVPSGGTVDTGGTGGTAAPAGSGGAAGTAPGAGGVAPLARSLPVSLDIPAIGVRSALLHLGLAPDGSLAVPQPGPRYDEAAWFTGSPAPGSVGPSVIEGHVDSAAGGPSVFFRLGALVPGDTVRVTRADGSTAVFTVNAVRQYAKDAFPTGTVYANTDHAALRLLTCGGAFDRATGHYRDNLVVYAHLTGVRR
jgi:hypothetical protein